MRRLLLGAILVLVWMLLWDEFTWGQLVAGSTVAVVLLALLPTAEAQRRLAIPVLRPIAALHLAAWFTLQFVISNFQVVRAALWPGRWVRPGVIRVDLHTTSPTLAALVSNITALTPGMQPVDARPDPPALYVHVLTLTSEEGSIAMVHRLEALVLAAFGGELDELRSSRDTRGVR
jgi:multicomponent Na+:H+ antiporter subunit E